MSRWLKWTIGAALAGAILWGAAGPLRRALDRWQSARLQAATDRLRAMVLSDDYADAAKEGAVLTRRFPDSPQLEAWYLLALASSTGKEEAVRLARQRAASRPGEPWSWFALACALGRPPSSDEALDASEKALGLMPRHPDFLLLRAETLLLSEDLDRIAEVPPFVDQHRAEVGNPAELLCVKARALEFLGSQVRIDNAQVAAAYQALEEARRIDPKNLHAWYFTGLFLSRDGDPEKGLPFLERAATVLSPGSLRAHREYWRAYNALDPGPHQTHRQAIEVDLARFLARDPSDPGALAYAAAQYGALGLVEPQRRLENRILKEDPGTLSERLVVRGRLARLESALDIRDPEASQPSSPAHPRGDARGGGESPGPPLARQEITDFRRFLWDYVGRPHAGGEDELLGRAYFDLFESLNAEPACDPGELKTAYRGMADHPLYPTGAVEALGAIAPADRGVGLDEAEKALRAALPRFEKKPPAVREDGEDTDDGDEASRKQAEARLRDALGWVLLKGGRAAEARAELEKAYGLDPGRLENLYHLGRLAQAASDPRGAADRFAECAVLPAFGGNPCVAALAGLQGGAVPAPAGGPPAAALERGRALRRERLLARRLPSPEAIPPSASRNGTERSSPPGA